MSVERAVEFGDRSLYETDYALWLKNQHLALRAGDGSNLDFANLAEEIEDLGKNLKREVASRLGVLLQHLIKLSVSRDVRPRAGWKAAVREQRRQLEKVFSDSPSLRRHAKDVYGAALTAAKADAHAALVDHEPDRAGDYLDAINSGWDVVEIESVLDHGWFLEISEKG